MTAGSKAFLMGILRQNNPYTDKKNKDTWDRGYNAAKRKYEADQYRLKKEAEQEAIAAGFIDKAPTKQPFQKRGAKPYTVGTNQVRQFNNKFRTAI